MPSAMYIMFTDIIIYAKASSVRVVSVIITQIIMSDDKLNALSLTDDMIKLAMII